MAKQYADAKMETSGYKIECTIRLVGVLAFKTKAPQFINHY